MATDGPANSLIVTSLIDGAMTTGDLIVSIAAPVVGAMSSADLTVAGIAYGILPATIGTSGGTIATDLLVLAAMNAAITTNTATVSAINADYTDGSGVNVATGTGSSLTNDGVTNITGAASTSTSDNLVTGGTGNDVIVLGTTVGANTAASSNETLVFGNGFGTDVVVNFDTTGFGVDHLDLTALNGATSATIATNVFTAGFTTNNSITVGSVAATAAAGTVAGITAETNIAALFSANNAAAQTHIYVSVKGNVGSVYAVTDAIGASTTAASVAVLQGTIDLGATGGVANWTALTQANFVNSGTTTAATNAYMLLDGPTGTVGAVVVPPVGGNTTAAATVSTASSGLTLTDGGAAVNTLYTVNAGTYTTTIAGFGAGDVLKLFAGAALSVTPDTNDADGIQAFTLADGVNGTTTTIILTGLTSAQDAGLFNLGGFATQFGAGTIA